MPDHGVENEINYYSDVQSDEVKVQAKLDHHTAMLGGMASIGRVVQFAKGDPEEPRADVIPRVLVQIGGASKGSYIRNWMPWTTTRAGSDGEWWSPELGEQVLVISPSGNLTQGIIVGSLYRGPLTFDPEKDGITVRDPIPGSTDVHKRIYKDGSSVTYDRNRHRLSVLVKNSPESDKEISASITADQSIVLTAGATRITVNHDGAVDIDAQGNDITISGNVKVAGALDVS